MRVDVWSDFVCPWCYLASLSLEKLRQSHKIELHWHAFELRPEGSPPLSPEYLARIEAGRHRLERIAEEHYGTRLHSGTLLTQARIALYADKYAEAQGLAVEHHAAVFAAYWRDGARIDQEDVLVSISESIGLNGDDYRAALHDPQWRALVQQDLFQASAMEITGVPAILFMGKYMISGAQPYEELVRILNYIRAREAP